MKRIRECIFSEELDLKTLVWTRGKEFPLSALDGRLKCPQCGSRSLRLDHLIGTRNSSLRTPYPTFYPQPGLRQLGHEPRGWRLPITLCSPL